MTKRFYHGQAVKYVGSLEPFKGKIGTIKLGSAGDDRIRLVFDNATLDIGHPATSLKKLTKAERRRL